MSALNDYISSLINRSWDEAWLPELKIGEVAAIASLANAQLQDMVKRSGETE